MKQNAGLVFWLGLGLLLPACQPAGTSDLEAASTVAPPSIPAIKPSPIATETSTNTPFLTIPVPSTSRTTPPPIDSPDLRVIYNNLDGIWLVRPPDVPVLLAPEIIVNTVLLSDDGTIAVYLTDPVNSGYPDKIGAIDLPSGRLHDLLTMEQITAIEEDSYCVKLNWIPNSHRMLFSTMYADARWGWVSNNDLYMLNLDTGSVSRIYPSGNGGSATPSPDGKRMAIARYGSLFLASIQGRMIYPDLFPSVLDETRTNFSPHIFWTPDSERFGIILLPYYPDDTYIYVVDASTGTLSNRWSVSGFYQGALSPALDYFGYSLEGESPFFSYDATVSQIDGSSPILLADGISRFGSFSPDGRHFTYAVGCDRGERDCPRDAQPLRVYIGSLDGTSILIPGGVQWINNSQFVYVANGGLRLGDVDGNWIEIAQAEDIYSFDAKNLDFHPSSA